MKNKMVLAINPGSTSTKLAIFSGEDALWNETLTHSSQEVDEFDSISDQKKWREDLIITAIKEAGYSLDDLDAVVARGGLLDPIPGGTYLIDSVMVADLESGKNGEHASNLAGIIAYEISQKENIPAYTVDPVGVDEFESQSRLSGLPELSRKCQSHALNLKAVGRASAQDQGQEFDEINQIGVHLGGGISIAAMKRGRIVDVNNANQGGPYSPERVGTLPALDLVEYIFDEKPKEDKLKKRLVGRGGLAAYLDTNDGIEIEQRIENGDKKAQKIYDGMIYQIGKEIGKMAAALKGKADTIFITGGLANSEYIVNHLKDMVEFIAPVKIYPGAKEMSHLVEGALRVLSGKEKALDYKQERDTLKNKKEEEMGDLI